LLQKLDWALVGSAACIILSGQVWGVSDGDWIGEDGAAMGVLLSGLHATTVCTMAADLQAARVLSLLILISQLESTRISTCAFAFGA